MTVVRSRELALARGGNDSSHLEGTLLNHLFDRHLVDSKIGQTFNGVLDELHEAGPVVDGTVSVSVSVSASAPLVFLALLGSNP